MKWGLLLVCAFALLLTPVEASAQRRMGGDLAAAIDSLMVTYGSRLNLTDEQQVGIREVLEAQAEKASDMLETARAGAARR